MGLSLGYPLLLPLNFLLRSLFLGFQKMFADSSHELIRKGVATSATAKPELLARVAQHKGLFFKTGWARFGEAAKGTLRVTPPESRLKALKDDYARMQQMFFGEPPEFAKIVALLRQWETEFNH